MPQAEEWTIGQLLEWTTEYLKEQGSDSPRLDAEILLAEACSCERIDLYTAFNREAKESVRVAFKELVRRRAEGTPVAHLVGRREFYSLMFRVTPDVLIPRPETEHVVIAVLDLLKERNGQPTEIADVGTGSGIIAVSIAKHAPQCRVTAIDVSTAALEIARKNVDRHGVADQVSLLEGNLLEGLSSEKRLDFVVSNPPYVSEAELRESAREVRDHEPHVALLGGPTGIEVIARLVPQAADRLHPGGWLIMECSPMIEPNVRDLIATSGQFEAATTDKDLAGLPRVVKAQKRAS